MSGYGSKIDLLFNEAPVVESIRQWIVLLLTVFLEGVCGVAIYRLFKTHRGFTYDSLVISIEAFKVFLFFIYEFAADHLILLMIVFLIQTTLRAVVCANFFKKALVMTDRKKLVRPFQFLYYGLILSIIALILVLSLATSKSINCEQTIFSYHWFILDTLDLFQSLLILLSAVFIVKNMKKQMRDQNLTLSQLSSEMKNMHCLQTQTKLLSAFYLVFVILDFMLMGIGNSLFEQDHDFVCNNGTELIATNNAGATFLLFYTLFLLSFTIMIWFVFYKIPDHFGLISKSRRLSRFDGTSGELIDSTIDNLISISKDEDTFIRSSPRNDDGHLQRKRSLIDVNFTKMKTQTDMYSQSPQQQKQWKTFAQGDDPNSSSPSEQMSNLGGINRSSFGDSEHKRSNSNLRRYFTNKNLKKSMQL